MKIDGRELLIIAGVAMLLAVLEYVLLKKNRGTINPCFHLFPLYVSVMGSFSRTALIRAALSCAI